MTREAGFEPVWQPNSRVLILGSFPSVKSRAVGFYYGNPQNKFWGTLCSFFGEEIPVTTEGKKEFLFRHGVALWDVVLSCEIQGSSDASIRAEEIGDLKSLFVACGAKRILCNGKKAYAAVETYYPALLEFTTLLPSTSPANPRFSKDTWYAALREIYGEL